MYSGEDPKVDAKDWVTAMQAYLGSFTCPEATKVGTILGRLERSALKWCTSSTTKENVAMDRWAQQLGVAGLLKALQDRFADREQARKAADKIMLLGSHIFEGSLSKLYSMFESLTSTPDEMSESDQLTHFLRAAPPDYSIALYAQGHKDWRSFGKAALDLESRLKVQTPSEGRKRPTSQGQRRRKGALLAADAGSDSDAFERGSTPSETASRSAVEPAVLALAENLAAMFKGKFSKDSSKGSASQKGKGKGRATSPQAQRPNLPRDVHWPVNVMDPSTLPWRALRIQEGQWQRRKDRGRGGRTVRIELLPGAVPFKGRGYRMSPVELDELRRQLETLTSNGWIRPSTSEFGAPFLFVRKGNGEFRMCVDYRGLNKITRKSTEPLPRIDDLLDMVQGCTIFSKIDLKSGYHQIEMAEGDVHKTAFKTRYATYEYLVMPFGLCNAPGTFQIEMHRILRPYLDRFVVVYLDDILVFSRSVEEHAQHLALVLQALHEAQYKINREKSSFGVTSVTYLGHVISGEGLAPKAPKIAAFQDWPQPTTVRDVRSFLGLASYYRKFVKNFSAIAAPLTDLAKKDTHFLWTSDCQQAFTRLKEALMRAPVLKLPDPTLPFVLTTDASQYGVGAVLQQDGGHGLQPVEYMSKKIKVKKLQDSTYEKELYALVSALKHWKHFLMGRHFQIYSDHSTLQWMKTQGELNDKLARYIQFIDLFDFELKHKKGCYNRVADALSRRPDAVCMISSTHTFGESTRQTIAQLLPQDPTFGSIVRNLQTDPASEPGYILVSDLLYTCSRGEERLCIPQDHPLRTLMMSECHDARGHFGALKSLAALSQRFSKHAEFIPLPEEARVPVVRAAFADRWVTHHGPPTSIISNRDPRFCSNEWQSYCKDYLHSRLNMTSGHHPEANGQAEVMNQILFQLLRPVISSDQQDWDLHLGRAQLVYNTSVHSSTGFTPYRLHSGREPRQPLDDIIDKATPRLTPGTAEFTRQYQRDIERARVNLLKAQKAMIQQANKHRRPSPVRSGDWVWVLSSELSREEDISPKLLPRYMGPWQVLDTVGADPFGPSYHVDVPLHLQTYPVFHASKLLPFTPADAFPDRPPQFGPPIPGKGYEVEEVVDEYGTGLDKEYLVKFLYQPHTEDRWFTRKELLKTAKSIILKYEAAQKGESLRCSARLRP
ncbi:hypothetical protein CBR_g40606 [Chara braunii]|uniref:Integrase catalytic domain-containing protein n=1 Tax=Chara braunii TaxID=69332 RepID=A0A388LU07_CHABU|nr:hypothetical protein CBR_g40606 [Chara braunii]|eukprot:GBG85797.1 hypothetical protein CBR_g40606 [Chara braunii]